MSVDPSKEIHLIRSELEYLDPTKQQEQLNLLQTFFNLFSQLKEITFTFIIYYYYYLFFLLHTSL